MQKYGRLVIKNSVLDSLVCSEDSLILETASPRTHRPKIVNESLTNLAGVLIYPEFFHNPPVIWYPSIFSAPFWQ